MKDKIKPYPLINKPFLREMVWGKGKFVNDFKNIHCDKNIGEIWEVSTHKNGLSQISNGYYKNKTLKYLIKEHPEWFSHKDYKFPLILKFIDTKERLSVQIHPSNEDAIKLKENDKGKSEAWYIIDCKKDAKLILGLNKNYSKHEIIEYLEKNKNKDIDKILNYIQIEPDMLIDIPPGTIHAILEDTIILEIQQSSDLTYRFYDWNRKDKDGKTRELHIEKAKSCINYRNNIELNIKCKKSDKEYRETLTNDFFKFQVFDIYDKLSLKNEQKNLIVICLENHIELSTEDSKYKLNKFQSCIIPLDCEVQLKVSRKSKIVIIE